MTVLRVWLVKTGEPWPTDGQHIRLGRTGIIARQYARAGDDIVWFNEIFDHTHRHHKPERLDKPMPDRNLDMVGLNGRGYRRAVSLSRMLHHGDVARDFRRRADGFEPPDAIVSSLIPLELCRETVRYGKRFGVPVVVDVRDLWPEVWLDLLPRQVRAAARVALRPYFEMLAEIVDNSAAICGVSEDAVDWALSHGNRKRNGFDGALPLAYEPPQLSEAELRSAGAFWSGKGIERDEHMLTICFFGNISHRVELDPVLEAVHDMSAELRGRVRIVFCGRGEAEGRVSAVAQHAANFHFAGWVNAAQIEELKRRSDVGLLPYPSDMDFMRSMPNKVFDYFSGGLPLLTCLKGVVARLIAEDGCGWMYENGDATDFLRVVRTLADDRRAVDQAAACARRTGERFTASEIYGRFRERLAGLRGEVNERSNFRPHKVAL